MIELLAFILCFRPKVKIKGGIYTLAEIVKPTEMCTYALANGLRTYNGGTESSLFNLVATSSSSYSLNCQSVSGTSSAKSLLPDGAHLVIARMAPGHVTRQGHFIVLSGWVTVNGKVY